MAIVRRVPTQLESDVIAALQRVSVPPATSKKRFIHGFLVPVQQISEKEANYALLLAYHFRKQLPKALLDRVWEEWYKNPQRLAGYTLTGELKKLYVCLVPANA